MKRINSIDDIQRGYIEVPLEDKKELGVILCSTIVELLKGLRADVNDPYKSNKAGDMIILIKKINRKIDNYDRAVRKRKRVSNRRI